MSFVITVRQLHTFHCDRVCPSRNFMRGSVIFASCRNVNINFPLIGPMFYRFVPFRLYCFDFFSKCSSVFFWGGNSEIGAPATCTVLSFLVAIIHFTAEFSFPVFLVLVLLAATHIDHRYSRAFRSETCLDSALVAILDPLFIIFIPGVAIVVVLSSASDKTEQDCVSLLFIL